MAGILVSPAAGAWNVTATTRAAAHEELLRRAIVEVDARIEEGVDRVKTSGRELPLIAVGGGSGLIPEVLAGVAGVHRPENHDVANAIGAAIASVSGELDRVFAYGKDGRDESIAGPRRWVAFLDETSGRHSGAP